MGTMVGAGPPAGLLSPFPLEAPEFLGRTPVCQRFCQRFRQCQAPTMTSMPGEANIERLLLTPADAAVALSISRTTVYELMNRGLLRSIKLGTCRRIPLEAIEELIDELGRVQSTRPPVTARDYISFQRRKETDG